MPVSVEFLRDLPKCEHHLHLEGSLEPDLLFPLAARNNVQLPETFPKTVAELNEKYKSFADLQDFLNYYYIGTNVLLQEQDFYDLAWAYFSRVAKQGLCHAEVFYDPQSHTERGISLETVTAGFKRACEQAEKELGITSKLIMCMLRHESPAKCLELVQSAKALIQDGTIAALGLDSAERPFPPAQFKECYAAAKAMNPELHLTAHAGEEGPAEYVIDALDVLHTTRIDHGINSSTDPALLERLARDRTMLTCCPLSNVKLQVVKSVSELPLQLFLDKDVPFSINSDDPAYFGGYILDNYIQVSKEFPTWDHAVFARIARNAIEGSWCSQDRKNELLKRVDDVVAKYSS